MLQYYNCSETYPEVVRIHMQFLVVHLAQFNIMVLDAIQVLHGFIQGLKHNLAVGGHFGIS